MANNLEAIRRNFLWGSFGSDFKCHLMRRNIVEQPMSQGGIDVKDLCLFNEALLDKELWRFVNEKGNIQKKVVTIKYHEGGFGWPPL